MFSIAKNPFFFTIYRRWGFTQTPTVKDLHIVNRCHFSFICRLMACRGALIVSPYELDVASLGVVNQFLPGIVTNYASVKWHLVVKYRIYLKRRPSVTFGLMRSTPLRNECGRAHVPFVSFSGLNPDFIIPGNFWEFEVAYFYLQLFRIIKKTWY